MVGTPVDKLLEQLAEAGMKFSGPEQVVTSTEKMKLLGFLRRTHGKVEKPADEAAPRQITLNRRKVEELTVAAGKISGDEATQITAIENAVSAGQSSAASISGSAVHEIDIARWLLGEELVSVTVHRPRASERAGGLQDPMLLVFCSASGVLVDVEVFLNAGYGYDVRCELVGELGTVSLDAPPPTVRRASGRTARAVPADWRPRFEVAYRHELQAWVDGIGTAPHAQFASAWDGYVAAEVAAGSIRAFETGQPDRIELRETPALYR